MPDEQPAVPVKQRAPTLWGIIFIKLVKGLLLLLLALGVYQLADDNLPYEFKKLLEFINFDPESQFFQALEAKINKITPSNVFWVATGTFLYSLLSLVEGVGLIFRISWAGWLVIGEAAFFVPLEVYKLLDAFSWEVFSILLINIGIVWYLFQNRGRLFRHHHHRHDH